MWPAHISNNTLLTAVRIFYFTPGDYCSICASAFSSRPLVKRVVTHCSRSVSSLQLESSQIIHNALKSDVTWRKISKEMHIFWTSLGRMYKYLLKTSLPMTLEHHFPMQGKQNWSCTMYSQSTYNLPKGQSSICWLAQKIKTSINSPSNEKSADHMQPRESVWCSITWTRWTYLNES